ncbi:hypothetical protein EW026_g1634 [Hermanssonia centrifuga]|uniref:Chromatin target of PRMT1 protein C-terminal domain-containing protein n=1 Tax=Hermanssonia centrifuga TaxID=98765 RepID=A0A4S4KRP9_9APHY|nr:hypothetical protein EW026_g1634 [Hermanssonia centrifuga]
MADSGIRRNGPGPIRNKGRSARGGRAPREPKKPKTAEELDMELDTFMKDDVKAPTSKEAEGDVEMAA